MARARRPHKIPSPEPEQGTDGSRPTHQETAGDADPGEQSAPRASWAYRLKFALVNACTVASLVLGLSAILLTVSGELTRPALCILGCVVFDALDGALARKLGVATEFGAQLDSLADLSAFGVATPTLVYHWLHGDVPTMAVAAVCAMLVVCAAIRLARFNVAPKDDGYFSGVPTTMIAGMLALCTLADPSPLVGFWVALVAGAALLMVSSLPYPKLGQLMRLPPWVWAATVPAALISRTVAFVVLVGAYLSSGPLLWLKQRRAA